MTATNGIFIFTRDRPQSVERSIISLLGLDLPVFLVDDSSDYQNQMANQEIIRSFSSFSYLGQCAFHRFLDYNRLDSSKYSFLLRQLGDPLWNLGYARNFALLVSKAQKFARVLFIDDDIQSCSSRRLYEVFEMIGEYDFVGADIVGMEDLSILDSISKDLSIQKDFGLQNGRMLSGGFLAFCPNNITDYFLNCYNEDWIWLYLQINNRTFIKKGSVFQAISDRFDGYEKKAIFQEFGEIVVDGILEVYENSSLELLLSQSFWLRILREREEYLHDLLNRARHENIPKFIEVIEWIGHDSHRFGVDGFRSLFQSYFNNKYTFQHLYSSL